MKWNYDSTECGRCGGSGHHSYNAVDGTRCYGCGGSGSKFTKVGRAAYDAVAVKRSELYGVRYEDVSVGEQLVVAADRFFGRKAFVGTVTTAGPDPLNEGKFLVQVTNEAGDYTVGSSGAPGRLVPDVTRPRTDETDVALSEFVRSIPAGITIHEGSD